MTTIQRIQARKTAKQVIASFPVTFGLQAFHGKTFRISEQASYVNDYGVLQLYTQVQRDGQWLDFAKDDEQTLRANVVIIAPQAPAKLVKVQAVLGKSYPGQPECKEISYIGTFSDGSSRVIRKSWSAYLGVTALGAGRHGERFSFSRSGRGSVQIEWTDEWVNDGRGHWVKKSEGAVR